MLHLVCLGASNVPGKTNKFVNLKSILDLLQKLIWDTVEQELVVRNLIALISIYLCISEHLELIFTNFWWIKKQLHNLITCCHQL